MMDKFIAGNDLMNEIVKVRYTGGNDGVLMYHEIYPVVGEKGDRLILETFYNGEPFHIEVDKSVCAPHSVEMKGKATPFEKIEKNLISLDLSGLKIGGKGIDMNNTDIMSGSPLYDGQPDPRYNIPKEKPKFSQEEIDAVIADNEIYRRTRAEMQRNLQREQVGYGMGKYPEPLTADTWTILETLGHIKGEIMDALHYITMLEIKFEKMGDK